MAAPIWCTNSCTVFVGPACTVEHAAQSVCYRPTSPTAIKQRVDDTR